MAICHTSSGDKRIEMFIKAETAKEAQALIQAKLDKKYGVRETDWCDPFSKAHGKCKISNMRVKKCWCVDKAENQRYVIAKRFAVNIDEFKSKSLYFTKNGIFEDKGDAYENGFETHAEARKFFKEHAEIAITEMKGCEGRWIKIITLIKCYKEEW